MIGIINIIIIIFNIKLFIGVIRTTRLIDRKPFGPSVHWVSAHIDERLYPCIRNRSLRENRAEEKVESINLKQRYIVL